MDDQRKTEVAARLKELLALFLPEIKKREWGPGLAIASDTDRICDVYAERVAPLLALPGGDLGLDLPAPARYDDAFERELTESDAGLALLVCTLWLLFLKWEFGGSGQWEIPALDDDMWPPSAKNGMLEQFLSNPTFPDWETVSGICAGVKARLPEGEALPASAVRLLRSFK